MMDILQKFIHLQVKEDKRLLADGSEKVTKKKTIMNRERPGRKIE